MGGDDDATVAAAVLDDRNTVHLLQALVDHARPANVSKAGRAAIAAATFVAPPTHVQLGDHHRHVVGGQPILTVQIFAHVGQRSGRVHGIGVRCSQTISLKIRCCVAVL